MPAFKVLMMIDAAAADESDDDVVDDDDDDDDDGDYDGDDHSLRKPSRPRPVIDQKVIKFVRAQLTCSQERKLCVCL